MAKKRKTPTPPPTLPDLGGGVFGETVRHVEAMLATAQSSVDVRRADLESFDEKLQQLATDGSSSADDLIRLQRRREGLEEETRQLEAHADDLQFLLESLEAIKVLAEQRHELQMQSLHHIAAIEAQRAQQVRVLEDLEKDNQKLRSDLAALRRQGGRGKAPSTPARAEARLRELEGERDQLRHEQEALARRVRELQALLAQRGSVPEVPLAVDIDVDFDVEAPPADAPAADAPPADAPPPDAAVEDLDIDVEIEEEEDGEAAAGAASAISAAPAAEPREDVDEAADDGTDEEEDDDLEELSAAEIEELDGPAEEAQAPPGDGAVEEEALAEVEEGEDVDDVEDVEDADDAEVADEAESAEEIDADERDEPSSALVIGRSRVDPDEVTEPFLASPAPAREVAPEGEAAAEADAAPGDEVDDDGDGAGAGADDGGDDPGASASTAGGGAEAAEEVDEPDAAKGDIEAADEGDDEDAEELEDDDEPAGLHAVLSSSAANDDGVRSTLGPPSAGTGPMVDLGASNQAFDGLLDGFARSSARTLGPDDRLMATALLVQMAHRPDEIRLAGVLLHQPYTVAEIARLVSLPVARVSLKLQDWLERGAILVIDDAR